MYLPFQKALKVTWRMRRERILQLGRECGWKANSRASVAKFFSLTGLGKIPNIVLLKASCKLGGKSVKFKGLGFKKFID